MPPSLPAAHTPHLPTGGWFGRYLRIDLSRRSTEVVEIEPRVSRQLIGGVGLGTWLLTQETKAGFDPLGEEAALVVAFGPLVGTPLTTSAKVAFVAKSPLTGRLNDALSSSGFAIAGKRTGFDALVLRGRAAEPSVVLTDGDALEVVPCPALWGQALRLGELEARLAAQFPGYELTIAGIAAEHRVRYASLANNGRHAGRGGLGAVLAAKQIKAVGVRGCHAVPLAHAERAVTLARDLARRSLGPATEKYRELGTVANLATFNRLAALPTRNFQESTFEGATALSGESLRETRARGRSACSGCTIGCEHFFEVTPGAPPVKAEYENVFALGPLCGVSSPELVLRASRLCDELGLDTISAGGSIAFAMECAERGVFAGTQWEAEAKGLRFGDGARMLELLEAIAHRRAGLGALLAEGSRRAAEILGPPAPGFAAHVKGLEIPGYEPRALQTMALGFAVSSRGADHNRSGAYEVDFSGRVDRLAGSPEAARLAVETEDRAAVLDSLILCKFLRRALRDVHEEAAEMLTAVTGAPVDMPEVQSAAKRIVLLKRLFNEREGWRPEEDTLPARFFEELLPGGAARGAGLTREQFEEMKRAYHEARGLNADGSLPRATIEEFGLDALLTGRNADTLDAPGMHPARGARGEPEDR
ncbi:aldehyde ferredoxin oxidoreductase family protein [Chondromyces crocatus]|uniref:Aldehyde ferredoxin oxidoreductase n=1 Tax=Chondromyces crocatus TaxID=52 RepID=A0A0K1ELR7_CHOCO|nr:aldehyde ferredoxin oxidoreductase family protein [Chondromyces crocatus]AKT41845.1 aldehyde ferredoxin oxidoreductase [Chondromyces crocatus]